MNLYLPFRFSFLNIYFMTIAVTGTFIVTSYIGLKKQTLYQLASNTNIDVIDVRYNYSSKLSNSRSVAKVPSRSVCSMFCSSEVLFSCAGFEYEDSFKKCLLLNSFSSGVNISPRIVRFRIREAACPANSTYHPSIRSCLTLIVGSMTWSDARAKCNNLNLNFHPLVINSNEVFVTLQRYWSSLPAESTNQCKGGSYWKIWTCGRWKLDVPSPFHWQPYQGCATFPFVYTRWDSGQPDNLYQSTAYKNVNNAAYLFTKTGKHSRYKNNENADKL
ncbi:hypothetical protein HELRODRAFT_165635 [Helobdella robusta]|uniref:C-type lectin domain-containing protein n=1 Tax=Helobdella robusta TaxID=6412 RepID=T1EX38_HELRO|nr:hypothetical protein HELRODRAFT_165635 [Helobdella robusta]ESN91581.1 hypothetical protein HELRODRAFT_165635 [Helobdella robusta]